MRLARCVKPLLAISAVACSLLAPRLGAAQVEAHVPTSAEASSMAAVLASAAAPGPDLIAAVSPRSPFERSASVSAGTLRSRLITIDAVGLAALGRAPDLQLDADGRPIGAVPSFTMTLFDDVIVRLVKLDASENDLDQTIIRAVLAGDTPGTATLVLDGLTVAGSVRLGSKSFSILAAGDGLHRVFELDAVGARTVKDDAVRHPFALGNSAEREMIQRQIDEPLHAITQRERASANTTITLLVSYTDAAAATIPNIKSAIALAVSDANTSLANSQIAAEIRLVGVERVTYQDTKLEMSDLLEALSDGTADFGRIQRLRAALDADLVSVVTKTTDACGLGWLNDDLDVRLSANSPRFGASVVAANAGGTCLATNTLAHEIGHNLGAEHDRFQVEDDEPGPTRYAYGYVDVAGRFRDLMSYDDECDANNVTCTEVAYFSNPDVTYMGHPVGIRFDLPAGADSARKIRATIVNASRLDAMIAPASTPALSVVVAGTGTVTSNPAGINCGDQCATFFSGSPQVALTATPGPRAALREWSGDCSGAGSCSVAMSASRTVTANFESAERPGLLYSSANADAQSFLRFYNTGTAAGTVTVQLADGIAGQVLGTWTSPAIAPGSAPLFGIATIESALPAGTAKPATYAALIKPGISGSVQHVLFRPVSESFTNLSTCEASTTTNVAVVAGVHSTLLDGGYPSTITIVNSGTNSIQPSFGLFDARTGVRLGTYTSPSIRGNAQLTRTMASIQTAAGIVLPEGANHLIMKADQSFTGFIQHLVTNNRSGVVVDLTATCTFGDLPRVAATEAVRMSSPLWSTSHSEAQSMLRFHNSGTSPGTVAVTLTNVETGAILGQWTSLDIPPGGVGLASIDALETALLPGVRPQNYVAQIEAQMDGEFQHIITRSLDGTQSNLSSCSSAVTANVTRLPYVHSSGMDPNFPSSIVISNAGGAAAAATLGVFDVATGNRLGTATTPSIAAGGKLIWSAQALEAAARITPSSGQAHYVVALEGSFRGFLQHLVEARPSGLTMDMTQSCRLPARSLSYTDCDNGFSAACSIQLDGTLVQGQVKKNGGFEYYRATLIQGQRYIIEINGVDTDNGSLASPFLFIHRADFTVAAQGSRGGVGRDVRFEFTPTTSGTHYFVVTGQTLTRSGIVVADPSGTYKISVRE